MRFGLISVLLEAKSTDSVECSKQIKCKITVPRLLMHANSRA